MPGPNTNALHADAGISQYTDVAPPISVSNIFEYPEDREELERFVAKDDVYSRCTQPSVRRVEAVLSSLLGGHAVAYANGVASFQSLVIALNPKRVFINHAYFGLKAFLDKFRKNGYLEVYPLEEIESKMQKGDLAHIESPTSPWGTVIDVESYVKRVHDKGGNVCLDATVGPPPIFEPFKFGVDYVIHSASKYMGGHSDNLAGVVIVKDEKLKEQLLEERQDIGSILGPFPAWLLLRSLRTMSLRVKQQSSNATKLVKWLNDNKASLPKLDKIYHSSLQTEDYVQKLLPNGGPAIFSIETTDDEAARELPNKLKLFAHATSMGGVESSIEWRALSDSQISRCLLRVSVGIEEIEDLIEDFKNALNEVNK